MIGEAFLELLGYLPIAVQIYIVMGIQTAIGFEATHEPHPGHAAGVLASGVAWPLTLLAEIFDPEAPGKEDT